MESDQLAIGSLAALSTNVNLCLLMGSTPGFIDALACVVIRFVGAGHELEEHTAIGTLMQIPLGVRDLPDIEKIAIRYLHLCPTKFVRERLPAPGVSSGA